MGTIGFLANKVRKLTIENTHLKAENKQLSNAIFQLVHENFNLGTSLLRSRALNVILVGGMVAVGLAYGSSAAMEALKSVAAPVAQVALPAISTAATAIAQNTSNVLSNLTHCLI